MRVWLAKLLYWGDVLTDHSEGGQAYVRTNRRTHKLMRRVLVSKRSKGMKYPPFIKDKDGKYDRIPYELMITTDLGKGFTQEMLKTNELARSFVAKYSKHFWQIDTGYRRYDQDETVYFHGRRSWFRERFQWLIDGTAVTVTLVMVMGAVTVIVFVVSLLWELATK